MKENPRQPKASQQLVEGVGDNQTLLETHRRIARTDEVDDSLLADEHYNRMLFECSPIGLALCRMDGSLVDVNPAFANIIGRSVDDCLAQTYWDITPISYAEQEKQQLAELQQTGRYGPYEKEYIHRDGHQVPVRLIGLVVEKGGEKFIWSSVEDISGRKKSEEALLASEERHRLLADTMLHGVVHQRADGTIVAMNPAAERILGKTQEELLGSSSVKEEHGTVREDGTPFPGLEHPAMVALNTGQPVRGVVMGVWNPKFNERRWIEIDAIPLSEAEQPQPVEVYTVFADITERMETEAALRESECRLRMVMEAAGAGSWLWEAGTNQSQWDNKYHAIYGFGYDTPRTFDTWLSSLHPEDRPRILERINEMTVRHKPVNNDDWNMEFRIIRPSGEIAWMHSIGRGERDAQGRLLRLRGINLDITARKHAETERERHMLVENMAQVQRLNVAGELAALLAHQINQPLTAIRSFAEAGLMRMKQGHLEASQTERILHDIVSQSERAAGSIRELRKFLARQPQEMRDGDLNAEIQAACSLLDVATRSKSIQINTRLAEDIPRIRMRASQIEQVVINLLENAADAITLTESKDRHINISSYLDPLRKEAVVTIEDSGPGLSRETAPIVFDPLYTTKKNGIGMGLSISRSIINEHGGRIWAEAGPSGRFSFSLPLPT